MPRFRGLPRGKRPDYFGPRQHRYNTPRSVGDWETRPSRGNRKWSFFLRGKSEQGLRFQIDDPFAARKYRSFHRLWCRSLKIDPIPFTPVSDDGQARGWRFLSPGSDTGYWEVVAYPGDDEQSEWCEYVPGQPQRNCITYIDDAGVEQEICTDGPIRYEYENDPSDIPGNRCEYGEQCRVIGRVTYVGYYESGAVVNNIFDFDLGPCGGPNSTLAIRREQDSAEGTLTYTDNDADATVEISGVLTWNYDLVGVTTKLVRWNAEITNIDRAACGTPTLLSRALNFVTVDGQSWDRVDKSFGTTYSYGDPTTNQGVPGMRLIYTNNGLQSMFTSNRFAWQKEDCYSGGTNLGNASTWGVRTTGVQVRADVGGSYDVTVNGSLYASYTNEPTDFVFTPGGGSGDWTIYVDRDGVEVYSDGPFSRNPGGSWFPFKKQVPYYDCEEQNEGNPPPLCTLVVYNGDTEIGRVTREDGTCPVVRPINDGSGNRLPTPGIRCTPVSYPSDPYYEIIWNEGEYTEPTSEYYYTCTCPYYSGQVTSLSDPLDASRSFNSGAPYFRYQQRVCKHIMAAMRANGDLTDADIPYDEQVEAQFYEGLNTRRYLETNPLIIPLQVCTPEYVDELMEELEMEAEPPTNSRVGMTWHDWDQSDKFGKWGNNWDSASKF